MSDNNNTLIIGAAILGYLYMKNNQARVIAQQQPGIGRAPVQSMPGNVGSGWQQVGVGAVAGFLQSVIGGVRNNTSQTVFPSTHDPLDSVRGTILNEGSYDGSLIGSGEDYDSWV